MRKRLILSLTILLLSFSISGNCAEKLELDPGGVSIDFTNLPKPETENRITEKFDLLTVNSNWKSALWSASPERSKKALKLNIAKWGKVDGRNNVAVLINPPTIKKIFKDFKKGFQTLWMNVVKCPGPGKYTLSFEYKGVPESGLPGTIMTMIYPRCEGDPARIWKNKVAGKIFMKKLPMTGQWRKFSTTINIPAECATITIYLKLYNYGKAYFTDIKLTRDVATSAYPCEIGNLQNFSDGKFCLSSGDPSVFSFAVKRVLPVMIKKPVLKLKLSAKVPVIGQNLGNKLISMRELKEPEGKFVLYSYDLSACNHRINMKLFLNMYDRWHQFAYVLYNNLPAGTKLPDMVYWLEENGRRISSKQKLRLEVIPPVKGRVPKIFKLGGNLYKGFQIDNLACAKILVEFLKKSGTNYHLLLAETKALCTAMKIAGMEYGISNYLIANGCQLGLQGKPEGVKFVTVSGKYSSVPFRRGMCPAAVYQKSKYYKENIEPLIRGSAATGANFLWSNWEPFHFRGQGCACNKCMKEFIRHSGLPEDQVKKLWLKGIIKDNKLYNKWAKFRSWQMAQVVKTIQESCVKSGKKYGTSFNFMPGVCWVNVLDSEHGRKACREYDPVDYAGYVKYLEPWGPYNCEQPVYVKGANLTAWCCAARVPDFLGKKLPAGKMPELFAFPLGWQRYSEELTNPEGAPFEILCYFVNRWTGAFIYFFPGGYDNRYWNAVANASSIIAEYEDIVFNSRYFNDYQVAPVSPFPPPVASPSPEYLPQIRKMGLLQHKAFLQKDKHLFATGNFWRKGEVFFKLKAKVKDKSLQYAVRDPMKKYLYASPAGKNYWTATELEQQGCLLHAGALRWNFTLIEVFRKDEKYGKIVSQEDMREAMRDRLPKIKKALEETNRIYKISTVKEIDAKNISLGNLICTPNKNGEILLKSGGNSMTIQFGKIPLVKQWSYNGAEILTQNSGKYWLAKPLLWFPLYFIQERFNLVKQYKTADEIGLALECIFNPRKFPELRNMKLQIEFIVNEDLSKLTVKSTLFNNSGKLKKVGYRYHNMPFCGFNADVKGYALIGKEKFERNGAVRLFYMGAGWKNIAKRFHVKECVEIDSPNALLKNAAGKSIMEVNIDNKKDFMAWIYWDSAAKCSMEPWWKKVAIPPGKSWTCGMDIKLLNN